MPSYPIQFKDTNLSYPKSCPYFAKISAWKTFDKPMLLQDAEEHQRKGAECSNSQVPAKCLQEMSFKQGQMRTYSQSFNIKPYKLRFLSTSFTVIHGDTKLLASNKGKGKKYILLKQQFSFLTEGIYWASSQHFQKIITTKTATLRLNYVTDIFYIN